jgi:hypothetical protein
MNKWLVVFLFILGLWVVPVSHFTDASAKKVNKTVLSKEKTPNVKKVKKMRSEKLIRDSTRTGADYGSLLFSNFIQMNMQEMDDLFSAIDSTSDVESGGTLTETLDAEP